MRSRFIEVPPRSAARRPRASRARSPAEESAQAHEILSLEEEEVDLGAQSYTTSALPHKKAPKPVFHHLLPNLFW